MKDISAHWLSESTWSWVGHRGYLTKEWMCTRFPSFLVTFWSHDYDIISPIIHFQSDILHFEFDRLGADYHSTYSALRMCLASTFACRKGHGSTILRACKITQPWVPGKPFFSAIVKPVTNTKQDHAWRERGRIAECAAHAHYEYASMNDLRFAWIHTKENLLYIICRTIPSKSVVQRLV